MSVFWIYTLCNNEGINKYYTVYKDQRVYVQRHSLLVKTLLKQHSNVSQPINILYSVAINQVIFYFLNVKIKIQNYKFICKFIWCSKGLNKKG
jgi:hypothetical protein